MMKREKDNVPGLSLNSGAPAQSTPGEALNFSNECWAEGLRLAKTSHDHYQHVMDTVRRTLTS